MSQFPGNQLDLFSRRLLERAGIYNDYKRCKLDPEEVFIRVLKSQGSVSLNFFYNIFGYMIDMDPEDLARDPEIRRKLHQRLMQEGLINDAALLQ